MQVIKLNEQNLIKQMRQKLNDLFFAYLLL